MRSWYCNNKNASCGDKLFNGPSYQGSDDLTSTEGMDLRDADVQLSVQRLRELMLWHGKDEGNLPPAATLVNLSRDTIAALSQLQQTCARLAELRAALAQMFWSCDSRQVRAALLAALGDPPEPEWLTDEPPDANWAPAPSGLSLVASELSRGFPLAQRATG
jgi:hypothetical protein